MPAAVKCGHDNSVADISSLTSPPHHSWVQYLCSLTYAVRLALDAEFGECANANEGDDTKVTPNLCKQLLENSNEYQLPTYAC
jgi:hypothetical protein